MTEKILTKEIYAMSIITQNSTDEVALIDHIKKFFTNIVNNDISKLTSPDRKNVFIIDDSLFNRTGCKKTGLSSRVFDHVSKSL